MEKELNLVFNFRALKFIENQGVDITKLGEKVSMSDFAYILMGGMLKHNKDITLEEVEDKIDFILESDGFEKGMEYISNKITEAFNGKK